MTLVYLDETQSAVADAFGHATINTGLTPPVGQYWLPTLVHVGTNNQAAVNGSFSIGRLSVGIAGEFSNNEIVDITYNATDDTTGVLGGTVVQQSQTIKAEFFGCLPGDTVYLRVVGLSSDTTAISFNAPTIQGPRFAYARPIDAASTTVANGLTGIDVAQIADWKIVNGATPLTVVDTSPQLLANKSPAMISGTITAGSNLTIVPAVAGQTVSLLTLNLDIDPGGDNTVNAQIQDTGGTTFHTSHVEYIGAASPFFLPSRPPVIFNGAKLGLGLGVQIHNPNAGSIGVFGSLAYSQN